MVSVTSDIASNVSFHSARSKSVGDDVAQDPGGFSALVGNNTASSGASDRSAAPPDAPAPRDDRRSPRADDTARRDDNRTADAASDARNEDARTKAAGDRADTARAGKPGKSDRTDSKPDGKDAGSAKDSTKDAKEAKDAKDAPDGKTANAATGDEAVPVAAVAVTIPVVTATVDRAAAAATTTGDTSGATAPLAIAAAVLKAQAAAADAETKAGAATGTEPASETPTAATASEPDFAALIAAATPAAAKPGAKQEKPTTEAKAETTAKPGDTDATAAGTPTAQPTTAAAPATLKDGKAELSADGAKPGTGEAVAKPAAHVAHERAAPDGAQLASADTPQPGNIAHPTQLAAAAPVIAAPQLTAALATNAPVPLNGVAVEIAQSAQSGKSRFDIRLDPAELGRIDVRLDVDRDGNVTSHLTVEKPETLAMLRQDAPQLQRALEQAGMKTSDNGLQFSLRDQSQGQQQNNGDPSGRQSQRLIISEDDSIPSVSVGRNYGRMLGSSRGVDISI